MLVLPLATRREGHQAIGVGQSVLHDVPARDEIEERVPSDARRGEREQAEPEEQQRERQERVRQRAIRDAYETRDGVRTSRASSCVLTERCIGRPR